MNYRKQDIFFFITFPMGLYPSFFSIDLQIKASDNVFVPCIRYSQLGDLPSPQPAKTQDALRIGLLGASNIA